MMPLSCTRIVVDALKLFGQRKPRARPSSAITTKTAASVISRRRISAYSTGMISLIGTS